MDAAAINDATIEFVGDDWGEIPVWRLTEAGETPTWSLDVHAVDADAARAAGLAFAAQTPKLTTEEKLTAFLETLPPDRVVTASDLLTILRPESATEEKPDA